MASTTKIITKENIFIHTWKSDSKSQTNLLKWSYLSQPAYSVPQSSHLFCSCLSVHFNLNEFLHQVVSSSIQQLALRPWSNKMDNIIARKSVTTHLVENRIVYSLWNNEFTTNCVTWLPKSNLNGQWVYRPQVIITLIRIVFSNITCCIHQYSTTRFYRWAGISSKN